MGLIAVEEVLRFPIPAMHANLGGDFAVPQFVRSLLAARTAEGEYAWQRQVLFQFLPEATHLFGPPTI